MDNKEYEKFIKLVDKMRYAQKQYETYKRPRMLQKAKDYEHLVDEHIQKVMQPGLDWSGLD